jgi:hypothetical protein
MTSTSDDLYSFEFKGETYTFEKPLSVVRSPRWLRANRRRDEIDFAFTLLEEVAGDEVLEVCDSMTDDEFAAFSRDLNKAVNASFQ